MTVLASAPNLRERGVVAGGVTSLGFVEALERHARKRRLRYRRWLLASTPTAAAE